MELISLFSGSSGNSILIRDKDTNILVDAGLSGSKIQTMLIRAEVEPSSLDAIFITHEHEDHIMGAGILSRRFDIPIFANMATHFAMKRRLGKIKEENIKVFTTGENFCFKDFEIHTFNNSHDAVEPVGFSFLNGKNKISIATDTGIVTEELLAEVSGSDIALIEANYNERMLKLGRYPQHLKERILGNKGHLSNFDASKLSEFLISRGTTKIVLGHLSNENNTPSIASEEVSSYLISRDMKLDRDYQMSIASRYGLSSRYSVGEY